MNIADLVIVRVRSMRAEGFFPAWGYVTAINYDGSVNVSRVRDGMLIANGQHLVSEANPYGYEIPEKLK
jgi:hypothetical protein